jgi:hypothetical protein
MLFTAVDRPVEESLGLPPTANAPPTQQRGRGVRRDEQDGEGYSQRVAKVKPTAISPMPTTRLYWPRSSKTGTREMSSLMT